MPEVAHVVVAVAEPMVGRILAHKLRREGHRVTEVRDAAGAAAALGARPDVVLLQPHLTPQRPVPARRGWLAVVDGRDVAAAHVAMREGAAGLVRMPFKPTDVAAQVTTLLAMVVT